MSLLDNLPHRCTIGRLIRTQDAFGGNLYSFTVEQTNVECWEQPVSDNEVTEYQKRGISVSTKVYFTSDPQVTERHRILITERMGVPVTNSDIQDVANPDTSEVKSAAAPDASVGLGILWRVMLGNPSGATQ